MALIKCPECNKEISDLSPACIHCGFPLSNTPKKIPQAGEGQHPQGDSGGKGPTAEPTSQAPSSASDSSDHKRPKGKSKKVLIGCFVAAIVLIAAVLIYLRGSDERAIISLFQENGYHVSEITVKRIPSSGSNNGYTAMSVDVTIEEAISQATHDALYGEIYGSIYGNRHQISSLVIYDSGGKTYSNGYFLRQAESEPNLPKESNNETPPIWQRTEADVIAAITYDLAGQLIYDEVFSIQESTTDSGEAIYSIVLNGATTTCGFTYLTDTDTGKDNLTLMAVDYTDDRNAKAFMIGASAMMLEADTQGDYTSIRDANAAFTKLYRSQPENSSTIRSVIGDGEYSIIAIDNTVLFSIKEVQ